MFPITKLSVLTASFANVYLHLFTSKRFDFCCLPVNTVKTAEEVHTDEQKKKNLIYILGSRGDRAYSFQGSVVLCTPAHIPGMQRMAVSDKRGCVCEGLSPGHPRD